MNYVTFSDFLDWTVIENIKTEIAAMLGDNMGDTLDQVCRDTILAGTTINYGYAIPHFNFSTVL